jgi:hypothetical protein
VRAYRGGARAVEARGEPLSDTLAMGGRDALVAIRGIGRGIAAAIAEMLETGRWRQLDRLKGETTPEALFRTVPGIGPTLAARLADTLEAETLEDLEAALAAGEAVEGIGPRRRDAILSALASRLGPMRWRDVAPAPEPPVGLLLDADRVYREKAAKGELRRIAPRRFNPEGEAWLPVAHLRRGAWHLTLLFSNTRRAHELGRTDDWVVAYFHEDGGPEGRRTIVTERRGPMAGKRVVRGREAECARHHGTGTGEGSAAAGP